MTRYKKITSFLIFCTLVLSLVPTNSANFGDDQVTSMIIQNNTGDIIHYQVDREGVQKRWTQSSDIWYHESMVIDIDNDNKLEVVMVSANEGIRVIDLESGEDIWTHSYSAARYSMNKLALGDLTGDDSSEIVVARSSSSVDRVMLDIFNTEGDLIQQIPPREIGDRYSGADEVGIYDIDQDGDNELVILYGASQWNYNQSKGTLVLQRYDWNSDSKQFKLQFETEMEDIGGATELKLLPNRIITAGWYNSPVRSFDANGNLMWENQLFENKQLNLADTQIEVIQKDDTYHLYMVSNNYWSNHSMVMKHVDAISGEQIEEPRQLANFTGGRLTVAHDELLLLRLEQFETSNEMATYFVADLIEVGETSTFVDMTPKSGGWQNVVSGGEVAYVILQDEVNLIASDEKGTWLVNKENRMLPFGISANIIRLISVLPTPTRFDDGTYVNEYNLVAPLTWWGLIMISTIILLGTGYYALKFIQDQRFDIAFGSNWDELFKLKIERFIDKSTLESGVRELPLLLNTTGKKRDTTQPISSPPEKENKISPSISANTTHDYKLLQGKGSQSIYELLNTKTQVAKQIKVGDMGLLIEILTDYPDMTDISSLLPKFSFATKSTIYKRIDKMVELGLLQNIDTTKILDDPRTRAVGLTDLGLQLLSIMHYTINQKNR